MPLRRLIPRLVHGNALKDADCYTTYLVKRPYSRDNAPSPSEVLVDAKYAI